MSPTSWQILKGLTFHHAREGAAERLLHTSLKNLYDEREELASTYAGAFYPCISEPTGHPPSSKEAPTYSNHDRTKNRVTISFGVSIADHLEARHNLSEWKASVLSRTHHAVSGFAGLIKAGNIKRVD